MNLLYLFVIIPLLLMGGVTMLRDAKQIKILMAVGASLLLATSFVLLYAYMQAKALAPNEVMYFQSDLLWYPSFNIKLSLGVDGISVLMIILSSIIVFTGVFATWGLKEQVKEFFLWFLMLSTGVLLAFYYYRFIFHVFVLRIALIPMYLLIGLGKRRKNIQP
jgi:NADH-quinone oxidoreductase subunit M